MRELLISKADAHTGVMVALYPSPEVAEQLAQAGGEPAEDLHVTLAYLGPAANLEDGDRLKQAVAEFAARTAPISGHVSGTGLFTAGPAPVTYASVDLPTLAPARERLIFDLSYTAWAEPSREHGFTPHITVAYDERQVTVPNLELTFDAVTLAIAGERTTYALSGAHAEWVVPLWKAEDGQGARPMIVYGVVLQPGVVDSQGDIVSAADIEKACHRYLVESRKNDRQHNEQDMAGVDVVENYIAPADLIFKSDDGTERPVLKGSWVMGVAIYDEIAKTDVRTRRLTGFSIGGSGIRQPA